MSALGNRDGYWIPKARADFFDLSIESAVVIERPAHADDKDIEAFPGFVPYRLPCFRLRRACRYLDVARTALLGFGNRFRRALNDSLQALTIALLVPAGLGIDMEHGDRKSAPGCEQTSDM